MSALVSDAAEAERAATYPAPYPDGWYRVGDLDDLPPGAVRPLRAFGRELVLFRGDRSGAVGLLDAHCPHLGAHLGVGARVHQDCIQCPFHHWLFATDGCLVEVPGLRPTPRIRTPAWPVRVVHGMIWTWFSKRGGAPAYEPEPQPDVADGRLVLRGRHDAGLVRMHLVEFAENSVDYRHFRFLHDRFTLPWTRVPVPGLRVRHAASWEPDAERAYVARFRNTACLELAGRALPATRADVVITWFGPGGIVDFRFTLPGRGDIVVFQTHTPVEALAQHVRFRWYADRRLPRWLVSYVVGHWVAQWQADVLIWEHKIHRPQPRLVRGDGPIHPLRRWFRGFYPEASAPEHRA